MSRPRLSGEFLKRCRSVKAKPKTISLQKNIPGYVNEILVQHLRSGGMEQ